MFRPVARSDMPVRRGPSPGTGRSASLTGFDRLLLGAVAALVALAGLTRYVDLGSVTAFACSGLAVAGLAAVVGRSVDQLGDRFGPGATGVLQSALGNLPELFIGIFALRAGLPFALTALAASSLLAALVSDWFVTALQPAIETLNISQAFAGLVVVAIAGNAVENVVGIQLAAKNRADYALSVIVNSPLQIALVLAPALVLLSHVVGGAVLTLVFSPMLVVAVALAVITVTIVIVDGESDWLEGCALLGLYGVIAAAFWWG